MRHAEFSTELPATQKQAFAYHERTGALQRLLPPWDNLHIIRNDASLVCDSRVVLQKRVLGIPLMNWHAQHTDYEPPCRFVDIQASGPMRRWRHEHCFESIDDGRACRLMDRIEYQLPGRWMGSALGDRHVRNMLARMFAYRHRTTADDLQLAADYDLPPLTIAISGASGLVGSCLAQVLTLLGHRVIQIKRGQGPLSTNASDAPAHGARTTIAGLTDDATECMYPWSDTFDPLSTEPFDAVVHLAGETVAQRWNDRVKERIRDSRVPLTHELCKRLALLPNKPKVIVSASATGFYGDRGDAFLNEQSAGGSSFLAEVARDWESACEPATVAGIRVVNLRIGLVVTPTGGALRRLMLPAKMGVNGPVSHGRQWWSWIALDDLVGVIYHAIANDNVRGPVNAVSPCPLTSGDFAKAMGQVLRRPAFIPTPATALRLAMGEMVDALLMASARVEPSELIRTGYRYRFKELTTCLRHQLGRIQT